MADLLQYLVPQSSQESFHSSRETFHDASHKPDRSPTPDHQPASPSPSPSPSPAPTTKPKQSDSTIAALQAAGLSVQDVNTYLTDPSNMTLLASTKKRKGTGPTSTTSTTSSNTTSHSNLPTTPPTALPTPEPVQLGGPKSSHHVTQLTHLAQERGLRPTFEFAEPVPMRFSVVLRVGEAVVSPGEEGEGEGEGDVTFGSKREAKEAVAAKGVEVLKEMPVPGAGPAGAGVGAEENWVGKLAEFYTTAAAASGPVYTEYALGTNYACECVVPARADVPFGARTRPFPNKKAAKADAAREAVLWLVERGDMVRTAEGAYVVNNVGSGKKKNKGKSGAGVMSIIAAESNDAGTSTGNSNSNGNAQGGAGAERKEVSFAARVNDLCPILGLSAPEYRLVPSPQAPSMYSGGAHFVQNPVLNGNAPVGEVRLVFGRKNAKEACAEKVLAFLRGVLRERGGGGGVAGAGL